VSSANYPDFTKFEGAENLSEAVDNLYHECTEPSDPSDPGTKVSTSYLGQCKIAALQRLAESTIKFVDPSADDSSKECKAKWIPGDKVGEGTIQVTQPKGVDCKRYFPTNREKRIDVVRQAAYDYDLNRVLDDINSVAPPDFAPPDLAKAAAALYAFCDTTLGVADPAECRKKQEQMLLHTPIEEDDDKGECPAILPGPNGPVMHVRSDCRAKFPTDSTLRAQEVQKGKDAYKEAQPETLTALVDALYRECAARQEANTGSDVLPCWQQARELGADVPYVHVDGGPGCRATWDSTRSHIILTGDRTACDKAFPQGDARGAAVTEGGKEYERIAALSGATDAADALTKLYEFCDSGKGGDPAVCKQQGQAALRDIKVEYDSDASCTARLIFSAGKATLKVRDKCGTAFPESSADWLAEVDKAVAAKPGSADPRSAALGSATDLPSAKAALYALCDNGKGGDPVACKKDADALLAAPILRTGTSCTPAVATVNGKPAIVVGPKCDKQFPDDPALRAAVIDEASKQSKLAAAVRGATDLAAAAKALYTLCDSGAQGDPVACKKAADTLLETTPIVRAGNKCTADVSTDNGKPVIVVGEKCAATAFPDDDKARAKAVEEAASPNAPAQLPPPNDVVPPQNPAGAPTSTSAPADAPPVEKPVAPEVQPPPVEKVQPPPVTKVQPPPVKKVQPPPVDKVEPPPVEKKEEDPAPPKEDEPKQEPAKESGQTDTEN
jgi:hypothetical protein